MLAGYLRERLGAGEVFVDQEGAAGLGEAIRNHRAVVVRTRVGHGAIPMRYFREIVTALGLEERGTD